MVGQGPMGVGIGLVEFDVYDRRCSMSSIVKPYQVPTVLPPGWRQTESHSPYMARYRRKGGLLVLLSAEQKPGDQLWLHVSASRPSGMPTWSDLREVKDVFIGDRYAYQVLPNQAHYVNMHPNVLHLFACIRGGPKDGRMLPEFSRQIAPGLRGL